MLVGLYFVVAMGIDLQIGQRLTRLFSGNFKTCFRKNRKLSLMFARFQLG